MLITLKNYFLLIFVAITSFFNISFGFLLLIGIELAPISDSMKKSLILFLKRFSHHILLSMLQFWFKKPIFIKYNKNLTKYKRSIFISNHCSDFDWLFISHFASHLNLDKTLYIMMKRSLSVLPLIGRFMKSFGHLFLNRSRKKDISIIKEFSKKLSVEKEYSILIFPEGTYPYPESLENSIKFAKSSKLLANGESFVPNRVLVPRILGFDLIRKGLKDSFEGVVSITILMNPYMKMPSIECSFTDIFITETKTIGQALIVDFVPKEKLIDNFLINDFTKKDKLIESYALNRNGEFRTLEDFKNFLRQSNLLKKNDVVEQIYIKSPYSNYFLFLPYILIFILILLKFATILK